MSISIPQNSPRSIYLMHKEELDDALLRTLDRGWYLLGQEGESFEKEFAAYISTQYAVGVGSGTDALTLALRACDVGNQDIVITVSHTSVATIVAIEQVGAIPVLVDIEPAYYTMDPNHLEECIKSIFAHSKSTGNHRLKAIIPVHLYGQPVNMPDIMRIAKVYGLHVIEDCAQAHGSSLFNRKSGTWGEMAAFSFYPTKNLGAFGNGGIVVSNDAKRAEKIRLMREYGWRSRYISEMIGTNSLLDELQAAVLRVKLKYLDEENARRRKIAKLYSDLLSSTDLVLPASRMYAEHVFYQYVVRTSRRDTLKNFLSKNNIQTGIHYPVPVHMQPAYRERIKTFGKLDHTEQAANEILSLPMFPYLKVEQVEFIVNKVKNFLVG
jgi:dTDP-4-amino-4,6-dideoxygalactose transaminase